jgi:hypothetical protein
VDDKIASQVEKEEEEQNMCVKVYDSDTLHVLVWMCKGIAKWKIVISFLLIK